MKKMNYLLDTDTQAKLNSDSFPLTDIQKAYINGRNQAYDIGGIGTHFYWELDFKLIDNIKLEDSLNALIHNQESLRTVNINGTEQIILEKVPKYQIEVININDCLDIEEITHQWHEDLASKLFDPATWPLFEFKIAKFDTFDRLFICIDMIMFDAKSMNIFFIHLAKLYNKNKEIVPNIKFDNCIEQWERAKKEDLFKESKDYWASRSFSRELIPELPTTCLVESIKTPSFNSCVKRIDKNTWELFQSKCEKYDLSKTVGILSIFGEIIYRWTNSTNFLLNVTVSNRRLFDDEINKLIGNFTSLEFLEYDYNKLNLHKSFYDKTLILKKLFYKDLKHNIYSGLDVAKKLMSSTGKPFVIPIVFSSFMGYDETFSAKNLTEDYLGINFGITQTSQVSLDNQGYEENGEYIIRWDYVEELFDPEVIGRMHNAYCSLIEYFSANDWDNEIPEFLPETTLSLIESSNSTYMEEILPCRTMSDSVINSSSCKLENIAVVSAGGNKTYRELREMSCRLGNCLREYGSDRNELVAVYSEKDWEQTVSCLGIQIAGSAYLPLNKKWPSERICDVLTQGCCKFVICSENCFNDLNEKLKNYDSVQIVTMSEKVLASYSSSKPDTINDLNDTAYVIFTSGSTGKPKGVTISHYAAMNTINDINTRFSITSEDRIFALSNLSFDLSVYDIYGLLSAGGKVVMPSEADYMSPDAWVKLLIDEKVTIWNSVPMLMKMLVEYLSSQTDDIPTELENTLRLVLLSGDWIPLELLGLIKLYFPKAKVISLGGATEGSIWSILYDIDMPDPSWNSVPYGKAMYNQKMYILDDFINYCPIGVVGEIHIGGVGVALNYWNDEEKTNNSFIINPKTCERLYKTGDLGKLSADGNIEFIGRKDNQVKIGGYRVEIGEVETAVKQLDFVKTAIVNTVGERENKHLAAYVVPDKAKDSKFQFKLQKLGIQQDNLNNNQLISLPYSTFSETEIDCYFKRKSYRQFTDKPVTVSELNDHISTLFNEFQESEAENGNYDVNRDLIGLLFKSLRAYMGDNLIFPKYMYPSAGGLYPVRAYAHIPSGNELDEGFYYYNPESHTLTKLINALDLNISEKDITIHFYGYLPAIEPEYKDASRPFCFLESGYMVALMEKSVSHLGYSLTADTESTMYNNSIFNNGYLHLSSFHLKNNYIDTNSIISEFPIYLIDKSSTEWDVYQYKNSEFNLICSRNFENITLNQTGANGDIVNDASLIMIMGSDNSDLTHIKAGRITQPILEMLAQENIGTCLLGIIENEYVPIEVFNGKYIHTTIAISRVNEKAVKMRDIILTKHSEKEKSSTFELELKKALLAKLPEYMLPSYFIELEQIPLTSNGKVDYNMLPTPESNSNSFTHEYEGPENDFQRILCEMYQEVLDVEKIGINDDFFHMGGDSILTIHVIAKLKRLGYRASALDVFKYRTVHKLSEKLMLDVPEIKDEEQFVSVSLMDEIDIMYNKKTPPNIKEQLSEAYPASYLQIGMLLESSKSICIYHNVNTYHINKTFNKTKFLLIWNKLVKKHSLLRAAFKENDKFGYIVLIYKKIDLSKKLKIYELDNSKPDSFNSIKNKVKKTLDIEDPGIFKLRVLIEKGNETSFSFIYSRHHAIEDGWSSQLLITEFNDAYCNNKNIINDISLSYSKFIASEKKILKDENVQKFWINYLSDYAPLNANWKIGNKFFGNNEYKSTNLLLDTKLCNSIIEKSNILKVSVDEIFFTAYQILISAFYSTKDIVSGLTVNIRLEEEEGDRLYGLFLNTIPFRSSIELKNTTTTDLIRKIHNEKVKLLQYKLYPYGKMKSDSRLGEDIFQCVFNYTNFYQNCEEDNSKQKINSFRTNIPLQLNVNKDKNIYSISFEAEPSFVDLQFIKIFEKYYLYYLESLLTKEYIVLLPLEEFQTIVYDCNNTEYLYSKDQTIHGLFEEQVERTPENTALIFGKEKLTYREFNDKSNQLAHTIRNQYRELWCEEVKSDTLIGIYIDRSFDMMIGILGILKSGAAYIPFDSADPEERLKFKINDCECKMVLTSSKSMKDLLFLSESDTIALSMDTYWSEICKAPVTNPDNIVKPTDLAYVIYTSGSTGNPKGAMLEHRGIVNRLQWMQNKYPLTQSDRILQKTPYIFDVSVWELFWANWHGAAIVIAKPEGHKDSNYLLECINSESVTVIHFVPSMFSSFLETIENSSCGLPETLRHIFCSGEALSVSHVQRYNTIFKNSPTCLHNLYGPTEASVDVTYFDCNSDTGNLRSVPIGKAIDNTKLYILDKGMNPVPIGVVGELYLGGAGLSRGYLKRPDLTNDKFVYNPFCSEHDAANNYSKLYKTGDLVRWLPDGNIEYIGRNDFQVKIHGLRIELGEIETCLLKHPQIKQAVVLLKERNNNQYLTAYIISEVPILKDELSGHLSVLLPDYMIPGFFVELEKIPLTVNGKVDRKALPDPEFKGDEDSYEAPRNKIEEILCEIWQEMLGIEKVGITDDFFNLGGDSIISIRVVGRLKRTGYFLSVQDMFKYNTISTLTEHIILEDKDKEAVYKPFSLIDSVLSSEDKKDLDDIYPASFLQKGMFIESELDVEGTYHDIFSYQININLDHYRFLEVWSKLVSRHAALRMSFHGDEKYGYIVKVHKSIDLNSKIQYVDSFSILKENSYNFEMTTPGLFRLFTVSKTDNIDSFVLVFSFHHCIIDGWSIASLISEFLDLYTDTPIPTEVSLSYGEFILNEQKALSKESNSKFWSDYLSSYEIQSPNFVFENTEGNKILKTEEFLSGKVSEALITLSSKLNISPDILFLSAFVSLLSTFYNSKDIVLGLVVNNRLELEGGDKLLGLFLNTIPLRVNLSGINNNHQLINAIGKEKIKVLDCKHYPYGKIKSDLNVKEDFYQCIFNYIHFHVSDSNLNDGKFSSKEIYEKTNIPLFLNLSRHNNDFLVSFVVHANFMNHTYLDYFKDYYIYYINSLVFEKRIRSLSNNDYKKIIYDWNQTGAPYPKDKTIHQLFEETAEKYPDNTAVVFEDEKLTYRELNEKSNQLANTIRTQYRELWGDDVKSDTLVGIYIERSLDMIIGIFGILKSGAAYVPFDSADPEKRLKFKINDCGCKMVLTSSKSMKNLLFLSETDTLTLSIDSYWNEISKAPLNNIKHINKSIDLAYIIYTSGSTGQPKGVMIEHRSLVNFIFDVSKKFTMGSKTNLLSLTNIAFDIFGLELYGPLVSGSCIYLVSSYERRDIDKLRNTIISFCPDIIQATPSEWSILADFIPKFNFTALTGGESLSRPIFEKIKKISGNIFNMYGPAETTIWSTSRNLIDKNTINIGTPLTNQTIYILDNNLNPVPVGVGGELFIGGEGLARGYFNHTELTKERFIDNPFVTDEDRVKDRNLRIYKTGDICRYLPDGNIDFIGRNDNQIKIRGFRIELGEIESKLASYVLINQSVVICKEKKSHKYLAAYYTLNPASNSQHPSSEDLIGYLSNLLPDYMIPSVFVELEEMPLNTSGKIDKKKLPDPEFKGVENSYVAPRNEIEGILCKIWQEMLGIEKVGITDDFFNLGGDSILSIQVSSRCRNSKINISVKDIIDNRTILKIVKNISDEIQIISFEQGTLEGDQSIDLENIPLSYMQDFYFKYQNGTNNIFNNYLAFKYNEINFDKLKKIIRRTLERHDVFKLKFENKGNAVWRQYYDTAESIKFPIYIDRTENLTKDIIVEKLKKHMSEISFQTGTPIITYMCKYSGKCHVFLLAHHLYLDQISIDILLSDIQNQYFDKSSDTRLYSSILSWIAEKNRFDITEYTDKIHHVFGKKQSDSGIYMDHYEGADCGLTENFEAVNFDIKVTENNTADVLKTSFATLVNVFQKWKQSKYLNIEYTVHGRDISNFISNKNNTNLLGWHSLNIPVQVDMSKPIREQLDEIMTLENALLYSLAVEKNIDGIIEKSPVLFNFTKSTDSAVNSKSFESSSFLQLLPAPLQVEKLGHTLEMGVRLEHSKLNVFMFFDKKNFNKDTINKITEDYKENLTISLNK